jgi:hypothetical protein
MNLVEQIKDQLTNQVTSRLGSLVASGEDETRSALGAVVPALLSAFSKLTSTSDGADQLASAVKKFNAPAHEATARLSQNTDQVLEQGESLLGSLFGGNTLSGLVGVLSKFVSLDAGSLKKLLAYVSPLVMGTIAKQFQGRQVTPQGLKSLFADQQSNIADAMPAGLSLASIPGLSEVGTAAREGTAAVRRTADATQQAGSSLMKALLPLAALALIAFLAWQFFAGRQNAPESDVATVTAQKPVADVVADAVPDATTFSNDLTSVFTTATETLSDVQDVASAKAALPKLSELETRIDGLAAVRDKLPEAARSTISQLTTDNFGKLQELMDKILAITGVKETLGPVLERIATKLKAFEDKA